MMEPLIEAWQKNNAVNLYLLDCIAEDKLDLLIPKSKPIRAQFAHLVNVRRMKLKMSGRDLLDAEDKSDRRKATKAQLGEDLISSGEAIGKLLKRAGAIDGKLKGSSGSVASFFGSLLVHEGFHRGQIEATLRFNGCELPIEAQIAMWEWQRL